MSEPNCTRRRHSVWTTCICPPCTADRLRKTKLHRNGHYNRVSHESAWAIIDGLLARGWSGQAIASAAGVPRRALEQAIEGRRNHGRITKFGPAIARAIVNHGEPTAGTVGAHGARRRLQGLARQGYDLETLAKMTGVGFSTLAAIRCGRTKTIRSGFHFAIRDTTASIGMTVGPSAPAAAHATRHGWLSLLVWDDIDDKDEKPSAGRNPGKYRRDELLAEWDHLSRAGFSMEQAAARLGLTADAIEAAVYRSRGGAA